MSTTEPSKLVEHYKTACHKMNNEVCQVLGKALKFPMYKDSPEVFSGSDDSTGYFTEPHTAESMADLAADKIAELGKKEKILRLALEMIVKQSAQLGYGIMEGSYEDRALNFEASELIRRTAETALNETKEK